MNKRSKLNPMFALDLDSGVIKDDYNRIYSVQRFKNFVNKSEIPLDMTFMCQRLILMNYNLTELRRFYREDNDI